MRSLRRFPGWPALALAVGLVAALAPLTQTRVLPFHDSAGIVGLGGALALRDDPSAQIHTFYDLDIRAYPSALYFGWAYLAGAVGISVETAFSLFLAIFCIAGPPLGLWLLLGAFGRPRALALLALPVSYHHQIWYGFLGSSAAVSGLLLAVAFARRFREHARLAEVVGLAAAYLFVAAAHPFPLALTLAVTAPLLLVPPSTGPSGARGRIARHYGGGFVALLPTVWFLAGWAAGFFGRGSGGRSLWKTVTTSVALETPALGDAGLYLRWLGNGYRSGVDEWVPALALASLAVFLIGGARVPTMSPPAATAVSDPASSGRPFGRRLANLLRSDGFFLGWAVALTLAGFLFLPMRLLWPEFWWGVRIRCVLPSYLLAIALVRPIPTRAATPVVETGPAPAGSRKSWPARWLRRGVPLVGLAPAVVVALVFFGWLTTDFRRFARERLAGFDEALAAIPPGRSVLGFPLRPDPHHTLPHPYLVQHYVARKGGRAVPHLRGHRGSYWITMKPPPDSPPWGDPRLFDFAQHGAWDYFLIEKPIDALDDSRPFMVPTRLAVESGGEEGDEPPARPHPMREVPRSAVRRIVDGGAWELWERVEDEGSVRPPPSTR
ncbi:MAG TPA: hypothetical protein VGF45_17190 [Polyangia bacterium]